MKKILLFFLCILFINTKVTIAKELYHVKEDTKSIESNGNVVFYLFGENLDSIFVKLEFNNEERILSEKVELISGNKYQLKLQLNMEEFKNVGEINFHFSLDGANYNHSITLPVSNDLNSLKIENAYLMPNKLKNEAFGKLIIEGKNLKSDSIKIATDVNVELASESENIIEYLIGPVSNETDKDITKSLNIYIKDQLFKTIEYSILHDIKTVSKNFTAESIYAITDDNNFYDTIEIYFKDKVMAKKSNLTEEIFLCEYYNLTNPPFSNELIKEVKIDENKLTIKLKKSVEFTSPRIRINEGIIYNSEKNENEYIDLFIKNSKYANLPKFIKVIGNTQTKLPYTGGQITIAFEGKNLVQQKTFLKMFDVRSTTPMKTISPTKIENINDKDICTFEVDIPENLDSKGKSYIFLISVDGFTTVNNSSENSMDTHNINSKIVVTVFPKDVSLETPIITHATISSYGATPGDDNTKTIVPTSQGSKKTFVKLYGSNLNKYKTKVKILDENNINWPVINNPDQKIPNMPYMVYDGNGVIGKNNYQNLEIILMNNLNKDLKFKYYFSADGLIFNDDVAVEALLLKNDGKDSTDIVNVTNVFLDQNNNKLMEDILVHGYSFFKNLKYNFTFEGYTLDKIENFKENYGKEDFTITYRYKKINTIPFEPTNTIEKDPRPWNNQEILKPKNNNQDNDKESQNQKIYEQLELIKNNSHVPHFTDIVGYEEIIKDLWQFGIITGKDDNTIGLKDYLDRKTAMTILSRLFNKKNFKIIENPFIDVKSNIWYKDHVDKLYTLGFLKGNDENLFLPDTNINNLELSVIISRIIDKLNINENIGSQKSIFSIPEWASDSYNKCLNLGIIKDSGDHAITKLDFIISIHKLINM